MHMGKTAGRSDGQVEVVVVLEDRTSPSSHWSQVRLNFRTHIPGIQSNPGAVAEDNDHAVQRPTAAATRVLSTGVLAGKETAFLRILAVKEMPMWFQDLGKAGRQRVFFVVEALRVRR